MTCMAARTVDAHCGLVERTDDTLLLAALGNAHTAGVSCNLAYLLAWQFCWTDDHSVLSPLCSLAASLPLFFSLPPPPTIPKPPSILVPT